jgi:hypothetical protein
MIWACPFRYFDKLSRSGRAVRSRFFFNCHGFKPVAIEKKSSTAIPHASAVHKYQI